MKKYLYLLIAILLTPSIVFAEDNNITDSCTITVNGEKNDKITDDNYSTYVSYQKNDQLKIECSSNIKNIYIMYDKSSTSGIITYNGYNQKIGSDNYLHELIKVEYTNSIMFAYNDAFSIADIYVFDGDDLPSWVEDWQTLEDADMMLFSTHADDEQLFFAGLLPTYVDKGYDIQVVYFTKHFNNTLRYHEQLGGLWAVGIKNYPVISDFPDAYATSLDGAITNLKSAGASVEDALAFEVDQIRKYTPHVVVGHDENGEYSHGQHMLNTYILKDAILKASDVEYITNNNFMPWTIDKLYLHLYDKNVITLNYDTPLSSFDNKTAYEVAKEGYKKHYSQQYTWFTDWLNGPNNSFKLASEIKTYSPTLYGLYYSSVGDDILKNDMFENVIIKSNTKENVTLNNIGTKIKETINNNNDKYNYMVIGSVFIFLSVVGIFIFKHKHK